MFQDWAQSTGPKLWTYHIPQWEWFWMTLTLQQCLGTILETTGWCESKSCQKAWKIMNENRVKELDPLGFFFFLQYGCTFTVWSEHMRGERPQKRRELPESFIYLYLLCFTRKNEKVSGTFLSTSHHFNVPNSFISHLKFLLVAHKIFLARTQKCYRK